MSKQEEKIIVLHKHKLPDFETIGRNYHKIALNRQGFKVDKVQLKFNEWTLKFSGDNNGD